jgi:2-oxoglutarate ferredoxin oxidoreductase subunit beta
MRIPRNPATSSTGIGPPNPGDPGRVADVVWGTSIGCGGRQTFATWKGDGFAGTHGRVYAIARGLRIALPPDKKLVMTVGDGDAFGIGLMHLINCARSNADMTVIVNDNLGYQSTEGRHPPRHRHLARCEQLTARVFRTRLGDRGQDQEDGKDMKDRVEIVASGFGG